MALRSRDMLGMARQVLSGTGGTFLTPSACPLGKEGLEEKLGGWCRFQRAACGQSFEVVNRRVVEDGPERTMLISSWREHVEEATDGGRFMI